MRVERDELTIRSAELGDAERLNGWWNDGRVMAHAGFPNGLNEPLEQTVEAIKRNGTQLSQRCIIECEGAPIGEMSYRIAGGSAEIGIKICEFEYQDRGLGTRFLRMLIRFLFSEAGLGVEKVVLDTNLKNLRAQHVYEKLGFEKLRVNENSWRDQLGQWQSSIDYEMTRARFEAQAWAKE